MIRYYWLPNGKAPVAEYIQKLDKKMQSKTLRSIALLEHFGCDLREPDSKHIEDGIFELRTTMGSQAGRVFYFFFSEGDIVLTHGFLKKSQKTPRREIERAKRYRDDYLNRKEANNG